MALRERAVLRAESCLVDVAGLVEVVEAVDFLLKLGPLPFQCDAQFFFRQDDLIAFGQIAGDLLSREEEAFQLLMEDGIQVLDRHLVAAVIADVLRRIGGHIHLVAAGAVCEAREEVRHLLYRTLPLLLLGIEDSGARLPEVFREDGFHLVEYPFAFRLELPRLLAVCGLGVVGTAQALGRGVPEEAFDGRIREVRAVPGPVSPLVEKSRHRLLPAMFQEKLVEELPDGCFIRVGDEGVVFPLVSERRLAAQGFAKLGADRNRERHALGDLLSLPLGHRGDHGVEEAPGRGRGIDGFGQGNQVRVVLSE
jgi:hypothetical protein